MFLGPVRERQLASSSASPSERHPRWVIRLTVKENVSIRNARASSCSASNEVRIDIARRDIQEQLKSLPVAMTLICSQSPVMRALAICHIACKRKFAIFHAAQKFHFLCVMFITRIDQDGRDQATLCASFHFP
jgi:hypothetical protein